MILISSGHVFFGWVFNFLVSFDLYVPWESVVTVSYMVRNDSEILPGMATEDSG